MNKTALFAVQKTAQCPQCGAELVMRTGKHGAFWGCSAWPDCDYICPRKKETQGHIVKVLAQQWCPQCGAELVLRQGRYGMFIGCSHFPQCKHIELTDKPDATSFACPQCHTGRLVQRLSRYGKSFHACDRYPTCHFTVNSKPVVGECPSCHFSLLMEKKTTRGVKRYCANKACGQPVATGAEGD